MRDKKEYTIAVRINDDMQNAIMEMARQDDRSISSMIRVMIKEGIAARQQKEMRDA